MRHEALVRRFWEIDHVKPGAQSHTRCDLSRQQARRDTERTVRKRALAFERMARFHGRSPNEAAGLMGLKEATLREWKRDWKQDRLLARKRGRDRARLGPDVYDAIVSLFSVAGGGIGYSLLRGLFPHESPAALKEVHRRFTQLGRRAERLSLATLNWKRVGSVWAMDFLYALTGKPIDNRYPYVLTVRDLASGATLLALPCLNRDASATVLALRYLFELHGAPLVLKSDNEFDADELVAFLAANRVIHLLSPPEFPRYNGAVEAGVGVLKTHTYYEAAAHGHPEEWSSNDIEAGRLRANELSRPNGFHGASPAQRFDQRQPISEEDRTALDAAVLSREASVMADRGLLPFAPLSRKERNAVRRVAIALALVDQGILQVGRRRFTPPFKLRFP